MTFLIINRDIAINKPFNKKALFVTFYVLQTLGKFT